MNKKHALTSILFLMILSITSTIHAEDTEIFATNDNPDAPNVLFVLDTSGSMKLELPGANGKNRITALKETLDSLISQDYGALNMGVMDFNTSNAAGIDFPVSDINADAQDIDPDIPADISVKKVLKSIINNYKPEGFTPMAGALNIASLYFAGENIRYGNYQGRPKTWNVAGEKYVGGDYRSNIPSSYENGTWFDEIPGSEHLHEETCDRTKPKGVYRSCLNDKYISYNCTILPAQAGKPGFWQIVSKKCDATQQECSWDYTGLPIGSKKPEDPDGEDGPDYVRLKDFKEAKGPEEECRGTYEDFNAGFDVTPTYKSPIVGQCQKNYVVLFGDGEPTSHRRKHYIAKRVTEISPGTAFTNKWGQEYKDCEDLAAYGEVIQEEGICIPDLIKYMREVDHAPDLLGTQTITTYTVGFALNSQPSTQDFLKLLVDENHGRGRYYEAESAEELTSVFQNLINDVTSKNQSFVSPLLSVNQSNRLATSEYVYMNSFSPGNTPSWKGEITRRKVDTSGFDSTASMTLSDKLSNNRTVYTYTGDFPFDDEIDLEDDDYRVTENNNKINFDLLGLKGDQNEFRTRILQWARGIDSNDADEDENITEAHQRMGDSLHSKPVLISYEDNKEVLFVTTNDGYLHAFDVSPDNTPTEIFAFIPQVLLKNLKTVYNNNTSDSKVYGLDGTMTVWQSDDDVVLYIGMRRGGQNYYALDVSDPEEPKLKWVIQGGIDGTDFAELGQSWSTPQLTKVKTDDDDETTVLIFGGGYDINQDSTTTRQNDTKGRAVFIVDADKGKLLWSAGPDNSHDLILANMKNSIPSDIKTIDFEGDGLVDRLYFGDTGGRVWRININGLDVENSTGYQLANFNDGSIGGNRRFYYAPSVAINRKGKLSIAIGSGYRAHPLATGVQDRLYVFEDPNTSSATPDTDPLTLGNLTQASNSNAAVSNWYVNLNENEKALSEPLIIDYNVIFTTYMPIFGNNDGDTCGLEASLAQAYVMKLSNGNAALSQDATKRTVKLDTRSIPDSPYIIFNASSNTKKFTQTADTYVGTQKITQINNLNSRMYWQKVR